MGAGRAKNLVGNASPALCAGIFEEEIFSRLHPLLVVRTATSCTLCAGQIIVSIDESFHDKSPPFFFYIMRLSEKISNICNKKGAAGVISSTAPFATLLLLLRDVLTSLEIENNY